MDTRTSQKHRSLAILLSVLVVGTLAFAAYSTGEALEERSSSVAAMDLRHAAGAVVMADALANAGSEEPWPMLTHAVHELHAGEFDEALHALDPSDAARAEALLAGVRNNGMQLLEPSGGIWAADGYTEIQQLLGAATENSAADAADAERNAVWALGISVAVLLGAVAFAATSANRSTRRRSDTEAQLHASQRTAALLHDSPDMFVVVNRHGHISYRSASADRLLPASAGRVEDLAAALVEHRREAFLGHIQRSGAQSESAVFGMVDQHGEQGWFDLRTSDLTDDALVAGHLITARDITAEVQLREELVAQASTDVLTNLPNRRALQPALDAAGAAVETGEGAVALLTIDIDGFKVVNDTYGHLVGDMLLARIARRLSDVARGDEQVLRVGGDEFAVVVSALTDESEAKDAADRFLKALCGDFDLGDRTEHVRASIGVALADRAAKIPMLIHQADVAMYAAKRDASGSVVLYRPALERDTTQTSSIVNALRAADFDQEFALHYQPIVDAMTQEVVSIEALLRWTSPELGMVSPGDFIPIAETCGEIPAIGRWVLRRVCQQINTWADSGQDLGWPVSFNVSAKQLAQDSFVADVLGIIEASGVKPSRLVVEVTESTALEETGAARERIGLLKQAGLRISIDDFGSGYSNLGQLLSIPFDVIKIDRSLLLTLSEMRAAAGGDAHGPCAIMEAIVSIAGVLDAPVVCEGVETLDQLTSLQESGVGLIQGYLTGRPQSPEQLLGQHCDGSSREPLTALV